MAKADLKTKKTTIAPADFIADLDNKTRREDAEFLLKFFTGITSWPAAMWDPSIIGYGRYAYKYASGREGEFLITGFSPRKANLVFYIMPGYRDMGEKLARLGKHKLGKSCLYVNKLADIDIKVLEEIVTEGVDYMVEHYATWPA